MTSNFNPCSSSEPARHYPMMRLSMFYLAGYPLPVGLLLIFAPQLTMKLLLTNHNYDDLGLRMGGVFLFAIGMIVVSMIINQVPRMYLTTLFVRAFITISLLVLYGIYRDPALLAISVVVMIGWMLTFISWRRNAAQAS
jgi:uncharacterized protein YjeT (DUF2065 family)